MTRDAVTRRVAGTPAVASVQCNVKVWRHDLDTGAPGEATWAQLPPDWRAWLLAGSRPIGIVSLVDEGHNLVVEGGLNINRDRVRGVTATPAISHVAIGVGTTPVTSGDTQLMAEVFRDVFTQVQLSAAAMLIRYYLGPNDANGFTLTEAGIFNAPAGPSLYARRLLTAPIVKSPSVAITIEWSLSWVAV